MKQALFFLLLSGGILILAACNLPDGETAIQTPTSGFETEVAMTLTALGRLQMQTPTLPLTG